MRLWRRTVLQCNTELQQLGGISLFLGNAGSCDHRKREKWCLCVFCDSGHLDVSQHCPLPAKSSASRAQVQGADSRGCQNQRNAARQQGMGHVHLLQWFTDSILYPLPLAPMHYGVHWVCLFLLISTLSQKVQLVLFGSSPFFCSTSGFISVIRDPKF